MPFYDYRCGGCGHQFEAMQKISAQPLAECPKCGEPELVKQISAGGFRLKGSGWYETDFKGGSKKKSDSSESHGCGSGGCSSCS